MSDKYSMQVKTVLYIVSLSSLKLKNKKKYNLIKKYIHAEVHMYAWSHLENI